MPTGMHLVDIESSFFLFLSPVQVLVSVVEIVLVHPLTSLNVIVKNLATVIVMKYLVQLVCFSFYVYLKSIPYLVQLISFHIWSRCFQSRLEN